MVAERFDRFAEQCGIWADWLERTRGNTVDAAHFAPPSADPASVRTTERLAINGQELDGTPVACITKAVSALRAQARRVREIARIYRDADQGNADRLRKRGGSAL